MSFVLPLTDRLCLRWEVLLPAAILIAALSCIILKPWIGLQNAILVTCGLVAVWIIVSTLLRLFLTDSAVAPSLPLTTAVVVEFDRMSWIVIPLLVICLTGRDSGAGAIGGKLEAAGVFGLVLVGALLAYTRREFVDITETNIYHRTYTLFGQCTTEAIAIPGSAIERRWTAIVIHGANGVVFTVPLLRLDRPIRFLAQINRVVPY